MNPVFVNTLASHLQIDKLVLWVLFVIAVFIFAVISSVLVYHWRAYGMRNHSIVFAQSLYISVSLLLLVGAVFSIISF